MGKKSSGNSRRNFLRLSSIVGAGAFTINDPFISLFARELKLPPRVAEAYISYELVRPSDMLHLRYYFFNAKLNGNYIVPETDEYPVFLYIQLPAQHIAEELVDPAKITKRSDFTQQHSFLAANSALAFRISNEDGTLLSTAENLLNWSDNFQLITIDDFAVRNAASVSQYEGSIQRLKKEFADLRAGNKSHSLSFHQNFANNQDIPWPITKFELPYKLFLSPIAEPLAKNDAGEFNRQYGEHEFLNDNVKVNLVYTSDQFSIVEPWENRLVFRNNENEIFDPRLKVVHWLCQHDKDKDQQAELLPMPIHREELHELTMQTAFDRDVLTTLFTISALGGNTSLKYKHDDPQKYSLVAWEQKVRYARDNYVSVTFRAVDVFTGIKLLISIIAERAYYEGVSFLPKLYYVSYAEKEKTYTNPVTISKVPFVKIIPKSKGAYFVPKKVENIGNSYHVAGRDAYQGGKLDCDALLKFDYVGIDKSGKEHPFEAKIIFIPAENYRITADAYTYRPRTGPPKTYLANAIVDITDIGLLNPSRQEKYRDDPRSAPCPGSTTDKYWYKLEKTFHIDNKDVLKRTLDSLKVHINNNKACYRFDIFADVTFARLQQLKNDKVSASAGEENAQKSEIRKDSSNATYYTRDILMMTGINEKLYAPPAQSALKKDPDLFMSDDPLMTFMEESYLVVSQIDQLEGKSEFRGVRFAGAYSESEKDIDADNPNNRARLLFKLNDSLPDFFSKNYRSAGAVVNPGIDITHVSVLDQGITYNESHNALGTGASSAADVDLSVVPSSSIFGKLNAKILDIPLTAIIEEVLPVEDLPVFTYLKQGEQSLARLQQLADQYRGIVNGWLRDYRELKRLFDESVKEIEGLKVQLKSLAENAGRAWLESLIEQSGAKNYYFSLQSSLKDLKTQYATYLTSVLKPISDELKKKVNLDGALAAVVSASNDPQVVNAVTALLKAAKATPAYSAEYLKEAVKYYCINTITGNPAASKAMIQALEVKDKIDYLYNEYYVAFTEGYKEATLFVQKLLEEQVEKIQQQLNEAKAYVGNEIKAALAKNFSINEQLDWVLTLYQVAQTYTYYYRIYENLRKEDYRKLAAELKIAFVEDPFKALEAELIKRLRNQLDAIQIVPLHTTATLKKQLSEFKSFVAAELSKQKNWLSNYANEYKEIFETRVKRELDRYLAILKELDKQYEDIKNKYQEAKTLYEDRERILRDYVHYRIQETKKMIETEKQKLLNKAKGSDEYKKIQAGIAQFQSLIKSLEEISKQKLEYTYRTRKFRPAKLGGAIDFQPYDTELTVRVCYEIEFDISQINRPPTIARQSFVTDSTITNFKIGLLQILYIDFLEVQFITGSDVKDDFRVRIRDVQFAGCLSFVQAFQKFLSTISDNLVFDIDASGAKIGYGFSIPDFSVGYFNFFNFNLSALLTLPFDPREAMQLRFGFGSPLNKFGLTVSGVFGGQGYFNVIAEPRRGIVGMEMVMEFGAILKLNLVVASGTAYLVGGIFIRRYGSKYLIRAYILAVGRFNVLGLFSASITFYLGLEGDGNVLEGVCEVKVSKRFSSFFEISVKCRMSKTLKGTKTEGRPVSDRASATAGETDNLQAAGMNLESTNLRQHKFYDNDYVYMVLSSNDTDPIQFSMTAPAGASAEATTATAAIKEGYQQGLYVFRKKLSDYKSAGKYTLNVEKAGRVVYSKSFYLMADNPANCPPDQPRESISDNEYYASYYL
jgi:hypothetical protein